MRPSRLVPVFFLVALASRVQAARPADGLLRLAPPEAGATLVVEDLRGHWRTVLDSPLALGLSRLPSARAWLDSDAHRQFRRSRNDIETALGLPWQRIVDDILGDAVVLVLQPGPNGEPEQARGLLLVQPRDQSVLTQLIEGINKVQRQEGKLATVVEHRHHGTTYHSRAFRPGAEPDDYYARLGDGTFAWSNSEALVRGVIERRASGTPGLGDVPRFRSVREGLPDRSAVSLFVDPRFLERAAAADPRAAQRDDEPGAALLRRYVAAVEYAGASLEWRDGLVFHLQETIDPGKLDDLWKRWGARPGTTAPLLRPVPPSALALASGHLDVSEIVETALQAVPASERQKLENGLTVLRGVLLDRDPRTEIFPHLGPALVAYIDTPAVVGETLRVPLVVVLGVGSQTGVSAALENGLRTLWALAALDRKAGEGPRRLETREVGTVRVTSLAGAKVPVAFAVDRGLLIVGTTPEAVITYLSPEAEVGGGPRFEQFRSAHFPDVETFAYVDLEALHRWAAAHRGALVRRLGSAGDRGDLDEVLGLIALFRGAFVASTIGPKFTSAHRTVGLIQRGAPGD